MSKQALQIGAVVLAIIILIVVLMAGLPQYKVWQQGLAGKAKLMRAGQERQILVERAKAEEDAATHQAKAIGIVGKAAQEFPEYRLQEFMSAFAEALQNGTISQIIYVPTEGNIPIMEASRFSVSKK